MSRAAYLGGEVTFRDYLDSIQENTTPEEREVGSTMLAHVYARYFLKLQDAVAQIEGGSDAQPTGNPEVDPNQQT